MIGSVVGSFRIESRIGAGGMGAVYLAEHRMIGRKAAIKVLLPQFSHNAELVSRFFNEARATALIKHPGLLDVQDFGFLPDGSAYLVMEYLEGESLSALLKRQDRLPLPLLAVLTRQIAAAVHAAHEKGIIHRDLKPDNIFLLPDPDLPAGIRVKVLDFGIAKLADAGASGVSHTRTGAVMGTPAYMSPEQSRGAGQVDRRSDVYALGCIMFEMACGRPPFVKEGVGELIAAQIYEPPPLPSSVEPSLSPGLETLILRTLAKEPADRPQSMDALRSELDQVVTGGSLPPSLTLAHGAGDVHRPRARHVGQWIGLGAGLLVVTGAVLLFVLDPLGQRAAPSRAPSRVAVDAAVVAARPVDAAAPALPARVVLRVESEPAGAEVYRASDGVLLGPTPYRQEQPASVGRAVFLLKLAGHRDARVELPADRSGSHRAVLVLLPTASAMAPAAMAPPVTARLRPSTPAEPEPRRRRRLNDGVADPFGDD
jgi:serine/threonine-protein kinase